MSAPEGLAALRKPFPANVVGKLPKGGAMLDYVGHAAVTDRLLSVDPAWTWEPVATDEQGLPAYDAKGGLWIRLTVLGVTRLGYGDGPDPKQRISDALRNAAMRFGVALDLWTKGELESTDPNGGDASTSHQQRVAPLPVVTDRAWFVDWQARVADAEDLGLLRGLFAEAAAQVRAALLSDDDAATARQLIEERVSEVTHRLERQGDTAWPTPAAVPA